MSKGYRYVKTCCGMCKKRVTCGKYQRMAEGQGIDSGTLTEMANCPLWDPEPKKKEGEK